VSKSILDLTFDDRGERVGKLQDSLITLGHVIPNVEVKAKLFGLGTGEALRAFQRKSKLRVTGKVDKRTEIALARSVTAAKDNKKIIEGRILLENSLPAKNLTLRFKTNTLAPVKQSGKAKTRELGSKAEFGRAKTDERGFYIFSFDPDKANNVEVVAESDSGEEVSLSKTKYNPERHEVLNLVAPAS